MLVPPVPPQVIAQVGRQLLSMTVAIEGSKLLNKLLGGRSRRQEAELRAGSREEERRWALARDDGGRRHQMQMQTDSQSLDIEREYWPFKVSPRAFRRDEELGGAQRLTVGYIPPLLANPVLMTEIRSHNESRIRDILSRGHPSVRFLGGWEPGRARDTSAMELLYNSAPGVPTALIQVDHIGNSLHLLTACYSFGPPGMTHAPIFSDSGRIDWAEHGSDVVRKNIEKLKRLVGSLPEEKRPDLSQLGEDPLNLALLEIEGASGERLDAHFRLTDANLRMAAEIVTPALQLLAVGMADFFGLQQHRASPRLPALLRSILEKFPDEAVQAELTMEVLENYQRPYIAMCETMGGDAPGLLTDLAYAMAVCPIEAARGAATELLAHAIARFFHDRKLPRDMLLIDHARKATSADRPFLSRVAHIWRALGNTDNADALERAMTIVLESGAMSWDELADRTQRT